VFIVGAKSRAMVSAFTGIEVATLANFADPATALLIRTAARTGLRFGDLAGLGWDQGDLEAGALRAAKQFTHGAWAELKTINSRRGIPLAKELVEALKVHRLPDQGGARVPGPLGRTARLPQLACPGVAVLARVHRRG
jgi:integrase